MALVRWEPARELDVLQSELNRLFDGFLGAPARQNGTSARRWVPAMDMYEDGDHFVLHADVPGLTEQDISLEYQDGTLQISGERKWEHEDKRDGYFRRERAYGSFTRSLTLPDGVDPEAIEANVERGVLEVRIPKPAESKPRRIAIGRSRQDTVEGTASNGSGS